MGQVKLIEKAFKRFYCRNIVEKISQPFKKLASRQKRSENREKELHNLIKEINISESTKISKFRKRIIIGKMLNGKKVKIGPVL